VQHFPTVFEVGFTARLEDQLDDIANGQAKWTAVMAQLWDPLSTLITQAQAAVAAAPKIRVAAAGPPANGAAGPAAPGRARGGRKRAWKGKGGGKAVRERASQGGAGAKPAAVAAPAGAVCPQCGQPLVERKSKYGPFVGCSGYPKCRYIQKDVKGDTAGSG